MQLEHDADPAVTHPGQKPQLPERPASVQESSVDLGGRIQKLNVTARGFDSRLVDMVLDAEPVVVDPERPTSERSREVDPSAQPWKAIETATYPIPDLIYCQLSRVVERVCLDYGQPSEVAGRRRSVETQVHVLERGETHNT
jgi:hypothetical protein